MRPTSGIFTYRSLCMLATPTLIYIGSFVLLMNMMYAQDWYMECNVGKPIKDGGPGIENWSRGMFLLCG